MVTGSLHARLYVRESRSLKDKRQVVRSVLDRLKAGFNVSAAEVGSHDDVKVAELGFAVAATDSESATHVLRQIDDALRRHPVAEYLGGELTVGDRADEY